MIEFEYKIIKKDNIGKTLKIKPLKIKNGLVDGGNVEIKNNSMLSKTASGEN